MNERIRELAVQAYNWAKEESREGNNQCRIGSDYFLMMEKAKFAELIVKECMSLCTDVEEDVELADYVGGFRDGASMCREDIKKHFGVEE